MYHNPPLPVHFAPLSAEHLADCLEYWQGFRADRRMHRYADTIAPDMELRLFDALFLMEHGHWWTDGQAIVLEIPSQQGVFFVDTDGVSHTHMDSAFPGNNAKPCGPPEVDAQAMARHLEKMRCTVGIGLHFQCQAGTELDDEEIVQTMWEYGCHPYLGKRIVADLHANAERFATVMPALQRHIPNMMGNLEPLGVMVSLASPMPSRGTPNVPDEHLQTDGPRAIDPPVRKPKFR